jgi:hypothetical protein
MSASSRLRDLAPELRMAAGAAAALAVTLLLPWYQKSVIPPGSQDLRQQNLSAFGVFSFVEAAVLLVAVAVLYLVWARGEGKAFHLPGGDGFAISLAGGWAMALLVWRLFDKPDVAGRGATVGIQWGIFGAMLAAGALVAAGARVRAAHRPEPPNPVEEEPAWESPAPRTRRREGREPRDATTVTEVLREPPAWQGEPPPAPGDREPRPPAPSSHRRGKPPESADPPSASDRLF